MPSPISFQQLSCDPFLPVFIFCFDSSFYEELEVREQSSFYMLQISSRLPQQKSVVLCCLTPQSIRYVTGVREEPITLRYDLSGEDSSFAMPSTASAG